MSINFNPTYSYPKNTPTSLMEDITQELKIAKTNNNYERITELLNRDLNISVSAKLVSNILLSLQEDELLHAEAILRSSSFEEMPTQDFKNMFYQLIKEKKFSIIDLLINIPKVYEIQQEVFNELESAISAGNNDLVTIILNCRELDEFPEERIENCFKKAKKAKNLVSIDYLLNHKKVSFLPESISDCFVTARDELDIEIALLLVNSKKFPKLSIKDLEYGFCNAVNRKTKLVEHILHSPRAKDFSLEFLEELAGKNTTIQNYLNYRLHLSYLHDSTPIYTPSSYLATAICEQDSVGILTLLNCKECNTRERLPIDDLQIIFASFLYNSHPLEVLNTIVNAERVLEINDDCFHRIIDLLLGKDLDLMKRFISLDPQRTEIFATHIFQEALYNHSQDKIKNFLSLFPDVELDLLPFLTSTLYEQNNLSLIESLLSNNKLSYKILSSFIPIVIDNKQVDILHKLVLSNESIRENLRAILENCFPNSLLYVDVLEYVIKNNLPQLTETILSLDKISKETFPASNIINHAIKNNNPTILNKLLINSFLWEEQAILPIIEYAVTKNYTPLFQSALSALSALSASTEKLLAILDSLTARNKPVLLEILLSMNNFSGEDLSSSLEIALQNKYTDCLAILSSCDQISRENLLPKLQCALEQEDVPTIFALSHSKHILPNDLQPIFERAIKNFNLPMIKMLAQYKPWPKEYLLGLVKDTIQNRNLIVLQGLMVSDHFDESDFSCFFNLLKGDIAMSDVFLTLITCDKFDESFLNRLLYERTFVNSLTQPCPIILRNDALTDAEFFLDRALETENREAVEILLKKCSRLSRAYIQSLTELLINKKLRTHLKMLVSIYPYTIEELKKLSEKSPKDMKWVFDRKISVELGYIN